MSMHIYLGEEKTAFCDCCGNQTRTVWGYVDKDSNRLAAYFVQWTCGKKDHYPNFDFLIGTWGDDSVNDKVLISWVYKATHEGGGSFMVIDSSDRPAASSNLCSKALSREEAIHDSKLIGMSQEIIDAIWLQDQRIDEITKFGKNA